MVRAFHQAGIEVILDVVFNHTAEGNELGPTLCFRGLANDVFYTLAGDKRFYRDYTGTGNTINADHPVVREHILDALRHWMIEMHVDGFRFDLASVLGRDANGVVFRGNDRCASRLTGVVFSYERDSLPQVPACGCGQERPCRQ